MSLVDHESGMYELYRRQADLIMERTSRSLYANQDPCDDWSYGVPWWEFSDELPLRVRFDNNF